MGGHPSTKDVSWTSGSHLALLRQGRSARGRNYEPRGYLGSTPRARPAENFIELMRKAPVVLDPDELDDPYASTPEMLKDVTP